MNLRTFAALAGLALGCAGAPAAPPAKGPSPADLFPLAVGNSWTYADESPALPPERRGGERTVRIVERTADGWFRDDERNELRAGPDCVNDRIRRLLCAPIRVGAQWASVVSVSSTERYEIAAVGVPVTTPAGTFAGCVRVRSQNRAGPEASLVVDTTYAPGVGPVLIESFAVVDGKAVPQVRAVLRAYRVAGR
jgi:hypothetical protein